MANSGTMRDATQISAEEIKQEEYTELSKRRRIGFSKRKDSPLYYHAYLGLDQLLSTQKLMSTPDNCASSGSTSDANSDVSHVSAAAAAGCPHATTAKHMPSTTPPVASSVPALSSSEANEAVNRRGAHDEHLFIVIHQAFELWFKQILWELGDAQRLLNQDAVPEREVGVVIARLTRVVEIFRLLVEQFTILETMTPLGFLEFRDYLFPASGFQSLQFRKIEQLLGLRDTERASYGQRQYCTYLSDAHKAELEAHSQGKPSLHDLLTKWLERTPFVDDGEHAYEPSSAGRGSGDAHKARKAPSANRNNKSGKSTHATGCPAPAPGAGLGPHGKVVGSGLMSDHAPPEVSSLWAHYRCGVGRMLATDRAFVLQEAATQSSSEAAAATVSGDGHQSAAAAVAAAEDRRAAKAAKQLEEIDARGEALSTILDADKFEEARARGDVRFSHKAMQAALLITLYQDEPVLNQASRLLRAIVDIDELMTVWRQRHALMVHRMIGAKMGTGGSSGYAYLTQAAASHRVFKDLFNLSTFLVPRHELPPLPTELREKLSFNLDN